LGLGDFLSTFHRGTPPHLPGDGTRLEHSDAPCQRVLLGGFAALTRRSRSTPSRRHQQRFKGDGSSATSPPDGGLINS